jgi:hypothetical protein
MPEGSNDVVWRKLYKRALEMRAVKAHVGVLASKGGSSPHEGSALTLAELAAVHEFGTGDGHVPERSFIRSTFFVRVSDKLRTVVAAITRAILEKDMEVRRGIGQLGAWGASEVKNTITQNEADGYGPYTYPPLADSTIARKGSSKPLVDTRQLVNAITWEIVDEGK